MGLLHNQLDSIGFYNNKDRSDLKIVFNVLGYIPGISVVTGIGKTILGGLKFKETMKPKHPIFKISNKIKYADSALYVLRGLSEIVGLGAAWAVADFGDLAYKKIRKM